MYRRGRPVDPNFSPEEILNMRCTKDTVDGSRLLPTGIDLRFPAFSVNRGKYSKPKDVLLPNWPNFGIVGFKYKNIFYKISTDPNTEYTTSVSHVPMEENYSHSEVRTKKNGVYDEGRKIQSYTVKKGIRMYIASVSSVIKKPNN